MVKFRGNPIITSYSKSKKQSQKLKEKRITANLTNSYFIQATFRTFSLNPVSSFNDGKIKLPDYSRRITTRDNGNVQSDDQEESELNSSINAN